MAEEQEEIAQDRAAFDLAAAEPPRELAERDRDVEVRNMSSASSPSEGAKEFPDKVRDSASDSGVPNMPLHHEGLESVDAVEAVDGGGLVPGVSETIGDATELTHGNPQHGGHEHGGQLVDTQVEQKEPEDTQLQDLFAEPEGAEAGSAHGAAGGAAGEAGRGNEGHRDMRGALGSVQTDLKGWLK